MSTPSISGAANSVGLSVHVTRKAQIQQVKDGKAAVSLIRANEALAGRVAPPPDAPAKGVDVNA